MTKILLSEIISNIKKNNITVSFDNSIQNNEISSLGTLKNNKKDYISFFHNMKYKNDLINTNAKYCFIEKKYKNLLPKKCYSLITDNPYKAFILTLNLFYPKIKSNGIISSSSFINNNAKISNNVEIHDGVKIYEDVVIEKNSIIFSNTVIGNNTYISEGTTIGSNCSIADTKIGKNCFIESGVVIGSNGFGFAIDENSFTKMTHLGKVIIGNDVEIGANTSIARGSLEDTIIGNNVRIDNLVHIAHNVKIGDYSIIAGQTGIAGSTVLGKKVITGGQVGISGHLKIGNNVKIAAKSGVIKNVPDNSIIGGYPATNIRDWHRATIKSYKKNDTR
tara:strand:+ start:197 stop:1198 length:1002 start_codon:yes stop_codon:yes gene_type:complete